MTEKLNHARVPRRFYILTLLIFVPIFYCLLAIRAHWYGWAIAVVAFAGLVATLSLIHISEPTRRS